MGWIISLWTGSYGLLLKCGLAIVICAGLFGAGYYKGSEHQKTVVLTKTVQKVLTQYKYVTEKEQPAEQTQTTKNKDNHDKIISGLPSVTPSTPIPVDCPSPDWGSDTISLLNSQRGSLPSQ